MREILTACSKDCIDNCSLIAVIDDNGKLIKTKGNPNSPATQGFLCKKGYDYPKTVYSPKRVIYPHIKRDGKWQRIQWNDAYGIIVDRLKEAIDEWGNLSILHNHDSGNGTMYANLDRRFFNSLGGVTITSGCLCWGGGYKAHQYDFGGLSIGDFEDYKNSSVIIAWGRNIDHTNVHGIPYIKEFVKNKGKYIEINPVGNSLSSLAYRILRPRPGTDGALALAMAKYIINKGLINESFIKMFVHGFNEFCEEVKGCNLEWASEVTGIDKELIAQLAELIASEDAVRVLSGFGLQRYTNGGNTIRAINGLMAIAGQVGKPGSGVDYAHDMFSGLGSIMAGNHLVKEKREILKGKLGEGIISCKDPAIKVAFFTRSNPVTQNPNTKLLKEAFEGIPFKVTIDAYFTDTALASDLFLPCTSFFEYEDIYYSSWQYYVHYMPKAIEPLGESKPDRQIFTELADLMVLDTFREVREGVGFAAKLLEPYGITLDELKKGPVRLPKGPYYAWEEKRFKTPTGKIELNSQTAKGDGLSPVASFFEPAESIKDSNPQRKIFNLHLITSHPKERIHSQEGFGPTIGKGLISSSLAEKIGIKKGDRILVSNTMGEIEVVVDISKNMRDDVVVVYEGLPEDSKAMVNYMIEDRISDMGNGTAYYDTFCNISFLHAN